MQSDAWVPTRFDRLANASFYLEFALEDLLECIKIGNLVLFFDQRILQSKVAKRPRNSILLHPRGNSTSSSIQ